MANRARRKRPSLKDSLYEAPYLYEFHQAVKILELLTPEATPLGEGEHPHKEAVQIKSRVYLSAPPSDIYTLLKHKDEAASLPAKMFINFMGLSGLQGALPEPYTDLILQRNRQKDWAISDFLDLFNHRLASLLHRIRRKYWIHLNTTLPHHTLIAKCLAAFTGKLPNQKALSAEDAKILYYAGLFWQRPRSAAGLTAMLTHYFGAPVEALPLQGRWLPLAPKDQTRLGARGQNQMLGQSATLGTRTWDINSHFRLRIGPLERSYFNQFLKTGRAYKDLLTLTQLYLGAYYTFTVNLIIKAQDICPTVLDGRTPLGWTSWLTSAKKSSHDDDQVVLIPVQSK